jgi:hypothetical protein
MKTAYGNVSAAAVLVAILAIARPADAATILVDLGATNLQTGTVDDLTWNNIHDARTTAANPSPGLVGAPLIADLVDTAGAATGISLTAERLGGLVKISGTAVDVDSGTPTVVSPSGITYPFNAYSDSLFVDNQSNPTNNRYQVTLAGLDTSKTYNLYFLAAAQGGNSNGNARFFVTGAETAPVAQVASFDMLVDADPANLDANFASVLGMAPDGSGIIQIQLTSNAGNPSNARWNTMEIVEVPEPASVGLGVLALGSLAGFAWRQRAADRRAA